MAPCLSKFPSLCLECIFKHVPVENLLRTIGLVCTNWYKSSLTELMRRKRLAIVEDEEQLETFNRDLIFDTYETDLIQHVRRDDRSPWLTLEPLNLIKFDAVVTPDGKLTIPFTSSLLVLSNITDFSFVSGDVSNSTITQVIRLIGHFSEHLIFLKLSFKFNKREYEKNNGQVLAHNMTDLFVCFNRLLSLRHFRFDLHQKYFVLFNSIRLNMSFLSRLTTVSIFYDKISGWILSSLAEHALNVGSIDLHNVMELKDFLKVDRKLDTKFNVLSMIGHGPEDFDDMKIFCTRFYSLTRLKLIYLYMPMATLAQCLSQLPKLVHVYLFCPQVDVAGQEEVDEEDEEEHLEIAQQEFSQVPSVRIVTLVFHTESHRDSEQFFIADIFPNLQVLRLKQYFNRCTDCNIHIGAEALQAELFPRLAECTRLSRQPFRRCANLHTVELFYYYKNDCLETMTDINQL